jgi:hypothetical protein
MLNICTNIHITNTRASNAQLARLAKGGNNVVQQVRTQWQKWAKNGPNPKRAESSQVPGGTRQEDSFSHQGGHEPSNQDTGTLDYKGVGNTIDSLLELSDAVSSSPKGYPNAVLFCILILIGKR